MPHPAKIAVLTLLMGLLMRDALSKPLEISEEEANRCKLLGDVVGNSGYGKNPNWKPIAKTYAENKAESLGATHTGPITYRALGSFNGEARTKAYACP